MDKDKNSRYKIGIVTSFGLGDVMVGMIMAHNLARNGFHVVIHSNFLEQLKTWVLHPRIEVRAFPSPEQFDLNEFDICLADAHSIFTKGKSLDECAQWTKKIVFFGMASPRKDLVSDAVKQALLACSDEERKQVLLPFANAAGVSMRQFGKHTTMVDNMQSMCQMILKLEEVIADTGLTPPEGLQFKKYSNRVVIHPTSANPSKNWPALKFIKLARKLKKAGFDPVFTVSPKERLEWEPRVNNEFPVPEFPLVSDLASFIYESGYMIGNDSGTGHLASALGIPTLSIFRSIDNRPRWRPGWTRGVVVTPCVRIKMGEFYWWKPFVSVNKVYHAFLNMVDTL